LLDLCRSGADREELFRSLLAQIADSPTLNVVVVEDIHWADEATLDLLRFIARRIRNSRVLLIATYRDEGLAAADAFRRGLGELLTQGLSSRIELAALSMKAVQDLASTSGMSATQLYQLTGGNPFYVNEVLRAGIETIPTTARDVILARAAAMSDAARAALDAAAIIGPRVEAWLLDAVAAPSPAVMDDLIGSGLLVDTGPRLRFRHEIARLALEQAVPVHRRTVVHGRILAALHAAACDDEARMAFHAESAGDIAAVVEHAPRAARIAVEMSSHTEAVAQYQRTLRFTARLTSTAVADLHDLLVDQLSLLDRWQEAADAGERALQLWRAVGDRSREGGTLRALSRTMWRMCRGGEANAYAEAAVEILEPFGPSSELAWAYASLARQRMLNSEDLEAIRLAQLARETAQPLGELSAVSDALNTEGCAAFSQGLVWSGLLEGALEVAVSNGFEEQVGRAFSNLHTLNSVLLRFSDAEQYFLDGIAYSEEHDMSTFATCLRGGHVGVLMKTGRWEEAEATALELMGRTAPASINRLSSLYCLGSVRVRRGQADAADLLDELMTAADGTGEPAHIVAARLVLAEAYWLAGEIEQSRHEVELADDVSANCDAWERGEIAVWLARSGSQRSPRGLLGEPFRSHVEGDVERAVDQWKTAGCSYDAAMVLVDTDDEASLRDALRVFESLGASATARAVRRKMRALGIKSIPAGRRQSTRNHPLGLTERERDVLQLVCDGCSNVEIAAELFLSPRTVDHHVSAILAKLDAPSRTDAAAHAVQLGLVAS
jgi:DNA-binding CsgD family transcriptional regulator/tetratricopeptide (TPR) repeat protein